MNADKTKPLRRVRAHGRYGETRHGFICVHLRSSASKRFSIA
jgi:hypothetical protein